MENIFKTLTIKIVDQVNSVIMDSLFVLFIILDPYLSNKSKVNSLDDMKWYVAVYALWIKCKTVYKKANTIPMHFLSYKTNEYCNNFL